MDVHNGVWGGFTGILGLCALSGLLKGPLEFFLDSFFVSSYHIDYNFLPMFIFKAN